MSSDLESLCDSKGLTAKFDHGKARNPCWPGDKEPAPNCWRVVLRYQGRRLTTDFYGGSAVTNPTAGDVVSSLVMDARSVEDCDGFERWGEEFGYDLERGSTSRKKARIIFDACERMVPRIHQLLGDDFEAFLESEH